MSENSEALAAPAPRRLLPTPEEKVEWAKRFLGSGLSLRQFSAQHGIGYMSLWRWVNKVEGHQSAPGAGEVSAAAVAFTEIKLGPAAESSAWVAELSWPDGKVVRLSKDVPVCLLEQLFRLW